MTDHGLPDALAADLRARYREPHRRYHDEHHLDAVLAAIDELADQASDVEAVRLAAWFHDCVYDPTRSDNEQASADLAATLLPTYDYPADLVAEVRRLIMVTAEHRPVEGDQNGAVLSDADLAVLGAARPVYDAYARAVREEYAHVSDADFTTGRAAVLRGLLSARPLFRTALGRERWETAARANLRRELAGLLSAG